MGFQEDMKLLERRMKQLEREYEQWFSGVLPKPPWDTKKAVEALVRRYNVSPPRSVAEQALFQMHQAKFNSYSEMWNRRTRLKEEGRLPGGPEPPVRKAPPSPRSSPTAEAKQPADRMRSVYEQYVSAKKKAGESTGGLNYESFRKALDRQAEQLRSRGGYKDVDFGVTVKNGKISVVARPKK